MYLNPRGSHNRKKDKRGFLQNLVSTNGIRAFADSFLIDSQDSSHTIYFSIQGNDNQIIKQIKDIMSSYHSIQKVPTICLITTKT